MIGQGMTRVGHASSYCSTNLGLLRRALLDSNQGPPSVRVRDQRSLVRESLSRGCPVDGRHSFHRIERLADRARVRWDAGPPGMTERNRRWVGFEVWKMLHLWVEGVTAPGERLRRGVVLLDYLLDLAFRLEGRWAPVQKHLLRYVADLDAALERLAQEYLAAPESTDRLRAVAEYLADKHELALCGEYKSDKIWPRGLSEP